MPVPCPPTFGTRLPGPFTVRARTGFPAPPGSLDAAWTATRPVPRLFGYPTLNWTFDKVQ